MRVDDWTKRVWRRLIRAFDVARLAWLDARLTTWRDWGHGALRREGWWANLIILQNFYIAQKPAGSQAH